MGRWQIGLKEKEKKEEGEKEKEMGKCEMGVNKGGTKEKI